MEREQISTESRLLAALAHGSVVTMGIGILVEVVVYMSQRQTSRYAAFQALQAAVFQRPVHLVIIVALWVVWGVLYGLSIIPLIGQAESNAGPPLFFLVALTSMVVRLIYMVAIGIYGLWGAIHALQGREFRYLVVGRWLERRGLWNGASTPART